jgi:hypothetical protein
LRERRGGGKRTSRPLSSLFKREKPSTSRFTVLKEREREEKRTSRLLLPLFRATSDLLVDLGEIASFWMRE